MLHMKYVKVKQKNPSRHFSGERHFALFISDVPGINYFPEAAMIFSMYSCGILS